MEVVGGFAVHVCGVSEEGGEGGAFMFFIVGQTVGFGEVVEGGWAVRIGFEGGFP